MSPLLLRCAAVLFGLATAADAGAQLTRVTSPNGRKVLEIRTGAQPNTGLLRTLVVTAGPAAGTTSLMVNTAFVSDIFGPNPPPMTWTVLVSSGTLFSLAGGCARGNLVDFPYINNNKLAIARFTGTTSTIITATINSADNYHSVNCVASPDGNGTLYILVNGTAQRTEIWRQDNSNNFTRLRQFVQVAKSPFAGGMRPAISWVLRPTFPAKADKLIPLQMYYEFLVATGDQTGDILRFHTYDVRGTDVMLQRAVAANPAAVPPVETGLHSDCAWLNQNWAVTVHNVGNNHCLLPQNPTPAGSGGGQNGYTWTAPGSYYLPRTGSMVTYDSELTVTYPDQPAVRTPSPHAGTDGPFALCHLSADQVRDAVLVAIGPDPTDNSRLLLAYLVVTRVFSVFKAGFESTPGDASKLRCEPFDPDTRVRFYVPPV